jgi:antitoxin component of RelBE/YafQ-DinJ toxin-antitoxin module
MPDKQMVSAKIAPRTKERLDNYKEEQGVSRSQAIDIMLKQGLDVEESDMRLVPVKTDGGTKLENEVQETQKQVDEVENIAEEIQSDIEDDIRNNRRNYAFIGIGIAYIVLELGIGLPSLVSIGIGIPLIIALIYTNFVRGTHV